MSQAGARARRGLRLSRASNGMLMSPEEFDAVTRWDENYRYELIHGVLVVSPPPSSAERDPNEELGFLLRLYKETNPLGACVDRTLFEETLQFGENRRRADRVVWVGLGRKPVSGDDVPTIAVEFVSRRSRDRVRDYVEKRAEYLNLGVCEYWVIDRFRRTLTVFRKAPAEPSEQVYDAAAVYRTPLLPGFELPLARLLHLAYD